MIQTTQQKIAYF